MYMAELGFKLLNPSLLSDKLLTVLWSPVAQAFRHCSRLEEHQDNYFSFSFMKTYVVGKHAPLISIQALRNKEIFMEE